MNLSDRRLASLENQGEEPPEATLDRLASELRFPDSFFYRPDTRVVEPDRVSFVPRGSPLETVMRRSPGSVSLWNCRVDRRAVRAPLDDLPTFGTLLRPKRPQSYATRGVSEKPRPRTWSISLRHTASGCSHSSMSAKHSTPSRLG